MKAWFGTAKIIVDLFKAESAAELDIPELRSATRDDFIEAVDWELRRSAEAAKKFGVTAWSLLAGFAAVSWALASTPGLAPENVWPAIWAFVVLEVTFLFGEGLWSLSVSGTRAHILGRAASLSTLGGPSAKAESAVMVLRFSTLFAASFAPSFQMPDEFVGVFRIITISTILIYVSVLVGLRLETPFVTPQEEVSLKPTRAWVVGLFRFALIVGPYFVLPMIVWTSALALDQLPSKPALQVAALLVAAGYLLRVLLVSNAESRLAPFLEQLRRDVVFGFLSPAQAAVRMARRVYGFPSHVYVNARLRRLTSETTRYSTALWIDAETLWSEAVKFEGLSTNEKANRAESIRNWLGGFPKWSSAGSLRALLELRGLLVTAFLPENAKKQGLFLEWKDACQVLETVGAHYVAARDAVIALLKPYEHGTLSGKA